VPFAAHTESGAVAGAALDTSGSNRGKMAPMSDGFGRGLRPAAGPASGPWRLRQAGIDTVEAVAVWHALAHRMTGTWRLAAT
jgi:hypothetical protein